MFGMSENELMVLMVMGALVIVGLRGCVYRGS